VTACGGLCVPGEHRAFRRAKRCPAWGSAPFVKRRVFVARRRGLNRKG
jgi:hypothetical protein